MGNACTGVCGVSDSGDSKKAQGSKAKTRPKNEVNFSIAIECYQVPTSRLVPYDCANWGPGASCRFAAVADITITNAPKLKLRPRASKLNSVVYTPVLQWFGVDVKEQVPKYLPMNMWPGTYTVFGFYNPEDSGSPFVTLTAKIGSENVCIDHTVDLNKSLTADEWSTLSRTLQREVLKIKSQPTATVPETPIREERISEVRETTPSQRDSLDTGYMSHKKSTEMSSPYSVRYIHTSDSDETSTKTKDDKHSKEKKAKMRRKDTPAFSLYKTSSMPLSVDFKKMAEGSPLKEETESSQSIGSEVAQHLEVSEPKRPSSDPIYLTVARESGEDTVHPRKSKTTRKSSCDLLIHVSQSCKDMREIMEIPTSPMSLNGEKTTKTTRPRKKRSLISKVGGKIIPTEAVPAKTEETTCFDHDADDEEDSCSIEQQNTGADRGAFDIRKSTGTNVCEEDEKISKQSEQGIQESIIIDTEKYGKTDSDLTKQTEPETKAASKNYTNETSTKDEEMKVTERPEAENIQREISKERIDISDHSDVKEGKKQEASKVLVTPKSIKKVFSSKVRRGSSHFAEGEGTKHEETGDLKTSSRTSGSAFPRRSGEESSSAEEGRNVAKKQSRSFTSHHKAIRFDKSEQQQERYKRHAKSVSVVRRKDSKQTHKAAQKMSVEETSRARRKESLLETPRTPKEAFSDS